MFVTSTVMRYTVLDCKSVVPASSMPVTIVCLCARDKVTRFVLTGYPRAATIAYKIRVGDSVVGMTAGGVHEPHAAIFPLFAYIPAATGLHVEFDSVRTVVGARMSQDDEYMYCVTVMEPVPHFKFRREDCAAPRFPQLHNRVVVETAVVLSGVEHAASEKYATVTDGEVAVTEH